MSDDQKKQASAARKKRPSGRRAKKGGRATGRDQVQPAGPPPPRKPEGGKGQAYAFHPTADTPPGQAAEPGPAAGEHRDPATANEKPAAATAVAASKSAEPGGSPQPSGAAQEPAETVLEFSQPSTSPPKPSGFKPDPEKTRKLRRSKQGADATPDSDTVFPPQPRSGSKRAGKQKPDQADKTAGQAKGATSARPGRPKPGKAAGAVLKDALHPAKPRAHPLFRKRNRSLTLAFVALVAVGLVWWTGVFEERFDLAHKDEPTTEAETNEAEALQVEIAAVSEAAGLLAALGLLEAGAEESSEQDLEAAIRMYQEMAGLTIDGQVSPELLEDLRAVAGFTGTEE